MTKQILLALAVCLGSFIPASAQISNMIKVTLPVAISVGAVVLPAGQYTIQDIHDNGNAAIFVLRPTASGASVELIGTRLENDSNAEQTDIVLKRVGDGYQLGKVQFGGHVYAF